MMRHPISARGSKLEATLDLFHEIGGSPLPTDRTRLGMFFEMYQPLYGRARIGLGGRVTSYRTHLFCGTLMGHSLSTISSAPQTRVPAVVHWWCSTS